jgi:hypothetical protein
MKGNILKLLEVLVKIYYSILRETLKYSENVEIEIISSQDPKVRELERTMDKVQSTNRDRLEKNI